MNFYLILVAVIFGFSPSQSSMDSKPNVVQETQAKPFIAKISVSNREGNAVSQWQALVIEAGGTEEQFFTASGSELEVELPYGKVMQVKVVKEGFYPKTLEFDLRGRLEPETLERGLGANVSVGLLEKKLLENVSTAVWNKPTLRGYISLKQQTFVFDESFNKRASAEIGEFVKKYDAQ